MAKKYTMHVLSGTHWDREWRHTTEQSKPRLIDLVESMMDILERKESYKTFCLDGGSVLLEDYLSVRPENRERLARLVKAGRVQLVNWYTLPETFSVSPEALIRNIVLGQEIGEKFGGTMTSGYTATSYGQTSQLPQIYAGCGVPNAIFYRGTNHHVFPPFFIWKAKDGTPIRVLKTFYEVTRTNWFFYVHQPIVLGKPERDLTYTYSAANLPVHLCDQELYERAFVLLEEDHSFTQDEDQIRKTIDVIGKQAKPYAIGNRLLGLNMEDNDLPYEFLPEQIGKMNELSEEIEFVQDSVDGYMETITSETGESSMFVHEGEIRYAAVEFGFNGLFGGTHSSRIKLKMLNEQAETKLINQAEPLASAAFMLGFEYPRTNLARAWRALLQNHAHDSICGAAVDQAHEDNLYNFSLARMVSEEIAARAAINLYKRIRTAESFKDGDHTITLFNMLPFERQEVVPLVVDLPKNPAGPPMIDPISGQGALGEQDTGEIDHFDIIDTEGNEVPYSILSNEDIKIHVERVLDTKACRFPAARRRVLLWAKVPAMGYATFAVRPRGPRYAPIPQPVPDRALLARENGVLENEHLKVRINPNGTFSMLHKESGRLMENLHYFTDNGSIGNAHLISTPKRNPVVTSHGCAAKITMIESNGFRGTYRIDIELTVPAGATLDGRDRLREEVTLPITTWLTLERGCPFLRIRTSLENKARDHRIRVNFPSGIRSNEAAVESAFAVDTRDTRVTDTKDNFEGHYGIQPMQNFVDLSDGQAGLAVLNKGLREYEVMDDADRTIAITLLRSHRAYMTANADMTPEEFDQYTGLHGFGPHEYRYALFPHTGDWQQGCVLEAAYAHKVTMTAIQGVPKAEGDLAPNGEFFSISPAGKLMFSAFKQANDGSGAVLRLWNTTNEQVDATIKSILPFSSAASLRLDEREVLEELKPSGGAVSLKVAPYRIATIIFRK